MRQKGNCHCGGLLVPQHIQRPAKCAWHDEKGYNFPNNDDRILQNFFSQFCSRAILEDQLRMFSILFYLESLLSPYKYQQRHMYVWSPENNR